MARKGKGWRTLPTRSTNLGRVECVAYCVRLFFVEIFPTIRVVLQTARIALQMLCTDWFKQLFEKFAHQPLTEQAWECMVRGNSLITVKMLIFSQSMNASNHPRLLDWISGRRIHQFSQTENVKQCLIVFDNKGGDGYDDIDRRDDHNDDSGSVQDFLPYWLELEISFCADLSTQCKSKQIWLRIVRFEIVNAHINARSFSFCPSCLYKRTTDSTVCFNKEKTLDWNSVIFSSRLQAFPPLPCLGFDQSILAIRWAHRC